MKTNLKFPGKEIMWYKVRDYLLMRKCSILQLCGAAYCNDTAQKEL